MSSLVYERDRECMLRRAIGRVADCHCWIVGVWYRNGRSVLLGETRERDNARTELEHIDMDGGAVRQQRVANSTEDVETTMMQPAVHVPNLLRSPRLGWSELNLPYREGSKNHRKREH